MIEKLREQDLHLGYIEPEEVLLKKINELVDAVNSIVSVQEKLIDSRFVVETKHEEPDGDDAIQEVIHADPYAEQRKWIGKVCKFWDNLDNNYSLALLVKIIEKEPMPFEDYRGNQWYHCEPVKPDSDIIYKGE